MQKDNKQTFLQAIRNSELLKRSLQGDTFQIPPSNTPHITLSEPHPQTQDRQTSPILGKRSHTEAFKGEDDPRLQYAPRKERPQTAQSQVQRPQAISAFTPYIANQNNSQVRPQTSQVRPQTQANTSNVTQARTVRVTIVPQRNQGNGRGF